MATVDRPAPAPTEVLVRVAGAGVNPATGRRLARRHARLAAVHRLRDAAGDRVRVTGILVEPDRTGMEAIAAFAADGRLRVRVSRAFPLEEAAAAHELLENGRPRSKLVLTTG